MAQWGKNVLVLKKTYLGRKKGSRNISRPRPQKPFLDALFLPCQIFLNTWTFFPITSQSNYVNKILERFENILPKKGHYLNLFDGHCLTH